MILTRLRRSHPLLYFRLAFMNRLYRFVPRLSIRLLILVVVVSAIPLAWLERGYRQARIVAEVEATISDRCYYRWQLDEEGLPLPNAAALKNGPSAPWLARYGRDYFYPVERIIVREGAELDSIKRLPAPEKCDLVILPYLESRDVQSFLNSRSARRFRSLDLPIISYNKLAGFREVGEFHNIRSILIEFHLTTDKPISAEDLSFLESQRDLRSLGMMGVYLSKDCWRWLGQDLNLEELWLARVRIDGRVNMDAADFAHLHTVVLEDCEGLAMPISNSQLVQQLSHFSVHGCEDFNTGCLASVSRSASIEQLRLAEVPVSMDSMHYLTGLSGLKRLCILRCDLSHNDLCVLAGLEQLEYVILDPSKVNLIYLPRWPCPFSRPVHWSVSRYGPVTQRLGILEL